VACFSHDDTLKESSAARVSSMRSQDRKPVYRPELKSCGQLTVERDVEEEDDVGQHHVTLHSCEIAQGMYCITAARYSCITARIRDYLAQGCNDSRLQATITSSRGKATAMWSSGTGGWLQC
jgi:hypothetical protein